MKNQNILLPLVLVVAAIVVGAATIGIGLKGSATAPVAQITPEAPAAEVSVISVDADLSAAAANTGARVVKWTSKNFPSGALVTINLIKKVSVSPSSYELVRVIAENTANDGSESWTPAEGESGDSYFVEVVCAAKQTSGTCRSAGAPMKAF